MKHWMGKRKIRFDLHGIPALLTRNT